MIVTDDFEGFRDSSDLFFDLFCGQVGFVLFVHGQLDLRVRRGRSSIRNKLLGKCFVPKMAEESLLITFELAGWNSRYSSSGRSGISNTVD